MQDSGHATQTAGVELRRQTYVQVLKQVVYRRGNETCLCLCHNEGQEGPDIEAEDETKKGWNS